jgi:7,8-dihydropterin-6-yl-methyl-4-(beta-D-ribofuranosyl)aminobenzene 5'-phosphate synthase
MTTPAVRLTVVCENTVGRPLPLHGEHGFACLVETGSLRLLFDTGRGATLLHNLDVLDVDPQGIDLVVLSHGHNDHAGGLLPLLRRIGPRPVVAHPGIFVERYFAKGDECRDISLGVSKTELESVGARFRFSTEPVEAAAGLWFSGYIPRHAPDETGDPSLVAVAADRGGRCPDPFVDDAALAVATSRGLVIVLGCAHAGLINTVEHFRRTLGGLPVLAVVGGTHLGPVSERQFEATVDYLADLKETHIGVAHCTGQARGARLYNRFPDRVFFAAAGCQVAF